ncbi:MAG: response regulator [Terriglobia bacterium]
MPRVLMAGFSGELKDLLRRRLGDYPISRISSAPELREELAGGSVSLLLLDHAIDGGSGLRALEEIRANPQWDALPVIYFLGHGPLNELTRKLVKDLRVREVLLSPLDPHEMARQAALALNIALAPAPDGPNGPNGPEGPDRQDEKIQRAIREARGRFLEVIEQRLEVLNRAGLDLFEGHLRPDLCDTARREAHNLAGLLGTIGFGAGSRFAREMEEILQGETAPGAGVAMRYSELLVALRLDLESAPGSSTVPRQTNVARSLTLLIVDRESEFSACVELEALTHGWKVQIARDFTDAGRLVTAEAPDVALVDVFLSREEKEGLIFLETLAERVPPVPVVVLTSKDTLTNRVEVAKRGGRGFLSRSSMPAQILEAVSKLVDRVHAAETRVMAVDDDPQVLDLLRSLLTPRGISLKALGDPLQFWEEFRAFAPDLLVLDVDMPFLSGVELCRVVRNDSHHAETPIIFLTRHNDPDTIQRIFSAGADDFVAKPIVGPELLTRIFNRLERVRMLRSIAETDLLTGTLNRRKSGQMMADFIELSRKHDQPFSLAALEVGDLPQVNREHGPGAGDRALEQIARALRGSFRSEDIVARWGGCEFVVGMYGLNRYDGVERFGELMARIQKKTFLSAAGVVFTVALSAGVAQYPEDGTNLEELYQSAATALGQAKSAGGGKAIPAGWISERQDDSKRIDIALVMRDEAQAFLLLHALESRGYRARWFKNGKTAAKLLTGPEPQIRAKVALMDVDLPGLDGISLLKQLAWDGVLQGTRVIMLTEPSASHETQTALELGAFDQVAKPFNPPVVVQHIRRAMEVS